MIVGIIAGLLILNLCIVIHELGHYVVMRRNGVKVTEFAVGFGRLLFQVRTKSGMAISLRLIPLGGYVCPAEKGPESVERQGFWPQMKIYAAGMFFNATASFVMLAAMCLIIGVPKTQLDAYLAGIPKILHGPLVVLAGSYGIWIATPALIVYLLFTTGLGLFTGSAGPIGMMSMSGHMVSGSSSASEAIMKLFIFFVMINSSLAGFNLLPLSILDGGHMFRLALTKIFGQRSKMFLNVFAYVSSAMLLLLFGGVIASDILRIFR